MTEQQIMKHLYALADFVYGETFSTKEKYEDVRCGDSLFRIYKKDNEVLNEVKNRLVSNPWHTGTPTEEGWYLLAFIEDGRRLYDANRLKNGIWEYWLIGDILEWQKIKEN